MDLVKTSYIDVALESCWRKIMASDQPIHVYVDRKHQIDALKEGTVALAYRQEHPGYHSLVGIYNAGVRKQDFIDDVLYVIQQTAKWEK